MTTPVTGTRGTQQGGLATLGNVVFRINPEDIKWNFKMHTNVQNTLGGRVVQVVGAALEDFTIVGSIGQDVATSASDGPGMGWRMAEQFARDIRGLMLRQAEGSVIQQQPLQTILFTYPAKGLKFETYIKHFEDSLGGSVTHKTGRVNYQYRLTLFIVSDGSIALVKAGETNGVMDAAKQKAIQDFFSRLADGIGWKQTGFNDSSSGRNTDFYGHPVNDAFDLASSTDTAPDSSPPGTPGEASGTGLSEIQVAQVAYDAGFRDTDLVTAVAIAWRESGGKPTAFNGNEQTGDHSYGLWQINMIGALLQDRLNLFGISNANDLFNPRTNAHAAYTLYQTRLRSGQDGFFDWGGYKGVQDNFSTNMPDAQAAVNAAASQGWQVKVP